MGSIEFAKKLLRDAKVAYPRASATGDYGDDQSHRADRTIRARASRARHQGDAAQGRGRLNASAVTDAKGAIVDAGVHRAAEPVHRHSARSCRPATAGPHGGGVRRGAEMSEALDGGRSRAWPLPRYREDFTVRGSIATTF